MMTIVNVMIDVVGHVRGGSVFLVCFITINDATTTKAKRTFGDIVIITIVSSFTLSYSLTISVFVKLFEMMCRWEWIPLFPVLKTATFVAMATPSSSSTSNVTSPPSAPVVKKKSSIFAGNI
jgi:hypothetical protein